MELKAKTVIMYIRANDPEIENPFESFDVVHIERSPSPRDFVIEEAHAHVFETFYYHEDAAADAGSPWMVLDDYFGEYREAPPFDDELPIILLPIREMDDSEISDFAEKAANDAELDGYEWERYYDGIIARSSIAR